MIKPDGARRVFLRDNIDTLMTDFQKDPLFALFMNLHPKKVSKAPTLDKPFSLQKYFPQEVK